MENLGRPGQLDTLSMTSDCHHQLVCLSFPLPHHQQWEPLTMSKRDKNVRLEVEVCSSAISGSQVLVCCAQRQSHLCHGGGHRRNWHWEKRGMRKLRYCYRFLQKSVSKGREHQSNQGKCLNFLLHLSWWMAEVKVCLLNRTLSLVNHSSCEGTALWGRCLWIYLTLHHNESTS